MENQNRKNLGIFYSLNPIPWPRPGLQNAVQGIHFRNTTGTAVCSRHFAPPDPVPVSGRGGQAPVLQYSLAQTWLGKPEFYGFRLPIITATSESSRQVAPGQANTPGQLFQAKPKNSYHAYRRSRYAGEQAAFQDVTTIKSLVTASL